MIQLYAVYPSLALQSKGTKQLKWRRLKKDFMQMSNQKTAKTVTLVLDKNKTESKMLQETKKEITYY